jgi:hypothetical protein
MSHRLHLLQLRKCPIAPQFPSGLSRQLDNVTLWIVLNVPTVSVVLSKGLELLSVFSKEGLRSSAPLSPQFCRSYRFLQSRHLTSARLLRLWRNRW